MLPSKPGPLEKGPGCIKVESLYRCAWWKELALCEIMTSCCLSKRPHRLICHRLALLIFRRFNHLFQHEMWEETTPNYLKIFFLLEVNFWTFLNPPPPKSVKRDVSPSLRNFYFGSAIRHESKFVHRYTPARKEELWPSNWHLSITLANCADRSLTRDAERCGVHKEAAK